MTFLFPSPEWATAYKDALNSNPTYKTAGKDWTLGIAEDTALWLDVNAGECRSCTLMPASQAQEAAFIIVADYARWKAVIKKELDPIKGMMQGKLKLTKGHMPTIVKYVQSSRELVETTSRVATKFKDE